MVGKRNRGNFLMIRYDLRCRQGHEFDSWFSSSSGFESLRAAGHLSCPICGGTEIDKALMAPALGRAAGAADAALLLNFPQLHLQPLSF